MKNKKSNNMKVYSFLFTAFSAFLFASCANDLSNNSGDNGEDKDYAGVTASVPSLIFEGGTRSFLNFDATKGMVFQWAENDQLTVLPDADNTTKGIYTLQRGGGTPKANFACTGFALKKSARYYGFNMTERETPALIRIPDKANITVDYSGQRQAESGTSTTATAHLGKYDFLAATGVCAPDADDHVDFDFQHLGFTMYIEIKGLTNGKKYRKLEIYDSNNTYRQPVRRINLTNGLSADGKTYKPSFEPEDEQSETYKQSPRFSLFLGQDTNNNNDNSDDVGVTVSGGRLDLFVELPPVDMRNNTFIFTLEPSDGGKPYYMKCDNSFYKRQYLAGYAYMMMGEAQEVTTFEVSLKINHDWQLGNTQTRATGDPGIEDHFEKPKYIYYVYCVGGKVQAVADKAYTRVPAKPAVGDDITIPESDWLTSSDKVFDTYQHTFTFTVSDTDKDKDKNVYFVASMEDISSSFSGISAGDDESKVQALLYSIPAKRTEPVETDAEYQTRSQTFLKNLYSTPWTTQATFVGSLKDPYQDVILYHTAAKVDLQWNSTAKITGDVKVNNVYSTNLSLFKPTANPTTGTANYTVTSTLEADRFNYGRQVFYLPQFNTYNVKVGSKDAADITFSPATTNGFTSWLRWQKVY